MKNISFYKFWSQKICERRFKRLCGGGGMGGGGVWKVSHCGTQLTIQIKHDFSMCVVFWTIQIKHDFNMWVVFWKHNLVIILKW